MTRFDIPGTLRPSQVITSFGPGSVAQMAYDSVMIMGFDLWDRSDAHFKRLNHPYLEEVLDKRYFKMPLAADGPGAITCMSFPAWGVCSNTKCRRLQSHGNEPPNGPAFACTDCGRNLHPAPFVLMCGNGHMDEFPWIEWAHGPDGECDNPSLRLRSRGKRLDNADRIVECDTCGKQRWCGGATSAVAIKKIIDGCTGRRPWLGDSEGCNAEGREGMRGVSIRAASLYYPSVIAALSVPEWSHPVQITIGKKLESIGDMRDIVGDADIAGHSLFEKHRKRYTIHEIAEQIKKRFAKGKLGENPSELHIRQKEYDGLIDGEFDGKELQIHDSPLEGVVHTYVDKLRQIARITEIRAISGFTRGVPPDPYSPGSAAGYCPISAGNPDWAPAIENKGEGLLFAVSETRLAEWESRPDVARRCNPLMEAYERWTSKLGWSPRHLSPRYLLLHTLSHAMIREVAYLSGYGEASIRERIYSDGRARGIMLYTANPSADGSLGGLVRQGRAENFEHILWSAVRRSGSCFRDPLCADEDPAEKKRSGISAHARVNGAACYGCALLPETSCENFNQLLDRRLLFDGEYGFFGDWYRTC